MRPLPFSSGDFHAALCLALQGHFLYLPACFWSCSFLHRTPKAAPKSKCPTSKKFLLELHYQIDVIYMFLIGKQITSNVSTGTLRVNPQPWSPYALQLTPCYHQMWETPLCSTPTCEMHSMGSWHYQFINFSMKNIHTSSSSDTVFCTSQVNTKKHNPSIQIILNVFPFTALTHLELPRNTL